MCFSYPQLLTIAELSRFSKAFDKLFFCHTASGFGPLMQPHSQLGEALLRFRIEGPSQKATGIVFARFVLALAAAGSGFYLSSKLIGRHPFGAVADDGQLLRSV